MVVPGPLSDHSDSSSFVPLGSRETRTLRFLARLPVSTVPPGPSAAVA